jgi:hypothetical protein
MNDQSGPNGSCGTCHSALENCRCFTLGDQVQFRDVLDPGDDECLFDVIEDNGDRVMIRLVCDLSIRPVKVVRRADVRRAYV